jgi:hypothetical protein
MAEDQRIRCSVGGMQAAPCQAITVIPEFLWELFLGVYAAVWGFRRDAPILSSGSRM